LQFDGSLRSVLWPPVKDEYPGGLVVIERGYWIAKHPVTHGAYAHFLAERAAEWPKAKPSSWDDPQAQCAADVPVVEVDWFDALLFCHWLTDKLAAQLPADHRVLLPTEVQWERAARGADARKYPWGDEAPTPALAVVEFSVSAVGGRPAGASPVGCHDMAGNVFEWCLTAYSDDLQALREGGPLPACATLTGGFGRPEGSLPPTQAGEGGETCCSLTARFARFFGRL
jgi:formylglycine-generating enzyme required for sulfatase activity